MRKCNACGFDNEDDARFCQECGAELEGTDPAEEGAAAVDDAVSVEEEVGSSELRLEVNRNHIYMGGYRGVLEMRLVNLSGERIEDVELELGGALFPRGRTERFGRLKRGEAACRKVDFRPAPEDAGENVVDVHLSYRIRQVKKYAGQLSIPVLAKEERSGNVAVDMREMLSDVEKLMGNVIKIDVGELAGRVRSMNDLLREGLPDDWQEVPLRFDHAGTMEILQREVDVPKRVRVFERMPMDRASLRGVVGGVERNFLLISRPTVHFGRQSDPPGTNDICLRVLPSTEGNDALSKEISRRHAQVHVVPDGAFVEDVGSKNGTYVDGERAGPGACVRLRDGSRLRMGPLILRVRIFSGEGTVTPRQMTAAGLGRGDADGPLGIGSSFRIESVKFTREGNLPEEQYIIVVKEVKIGRSLGNAIVLPDPSVDEIHARLFFFERQYWIEDLRSSGGTSVGSERLAPGEAMPLWDGAELAFGGVRMAFCAPRQLYIDVE